MVEDDDGNVGVVMELSSNLMQFYRTIHGGAIAGLLDACIATAVNHQISDQEGAATMEMKINYLRPVSEGRLWGKGKIIHKGRKIVVGQGEIKDDTGQIVAFGTATFMIYRLPG